MRPLAIDLYCGLSGWGEGLVAEGWRVVGFDLEDMAAQFGVIRPPHFGLVLQDVTTLHGRQFRDAALIVASPPCQAYSYRAMPWKRAKALPPPDNTLFKTCFRLQREAIEAAGRFIPLVVENVCGAQKWVGRAKWHFGSFFLWGDVPALMPITRPHVKHPGAWLEKGSPKFRCAGVDGVKGFTPNGEPLGKNQLGKHGSRSSARKAASAHIAKIPIGAGAAHCPRLVPDARGAERMKTDDQEKERLRSRIADHCVAIEDLFLKPVKVTCVVRLPGNDEADVLVTNEPNLDDVVAAVERAKKREVISAT